MNLDTLVQTFRNQATSTNSIILNSDVLPQTELDKLSTAFLLGKNIGATNIVALDERGQEAFNDKITVLAEPGNIVTLQRGMKGQETLSCMDDRCRSKPTVGDAPGPFDGTLGQMLKSDAVKKGAAGQ